MSSAWEEKMEAEADNCALVFTAATTPRIRHKAYFKCGARWSREQTLAEVESILKRIAEYGPEQGTKIDGVACAFCDMGDCGYASKGKGFHDDECAVKDAQLILQENFKKESK